MHSSATSPDQYLAELPDDRRDVMERLHETIVANLPDGYEPGMAYGMINYLIPLADYPAGYHVTGGPLSILGIASQKQHVAIYHMGIYADAELESWFREKYAKLGIGKLDMGKSCIRFRNPKNIPFELIGELAGKVTPQQYIEAYESAREGRR